jgi:hypothetical protein
MRVVPHHERPQSRRDFLLRAGGGFGWLALHSLMQQEAAAAEPLPSRNPVAPRPGHFKGRAKSVIWLFLEGGPSHVDLFDPKPELTRLAGQPLPPSFKRPVTAMGRTAHTPLLATQRKFAQHGKSGIWVSDWYPEVATCVDDIAVIRSCWANGLNHVGSVCQMNTGTVLAGRPSLGAWALYGLGTENQNLPGFVVIQDYPEEVSGGNRVWGTGFMPATYQGTRFREGKSPILYLTPEHGVDPALQRAKIDLIQQLNQKHRETRREDDELEARIASYELAYRMQAAAPEAVDLAKETEETKRLYGLDNKDTERMGRNCLFARRLVERGVRCVQVFSGAGSKWDAHADVEQNHGKMCKESDKPIAALLKDLKRRGLLDTTLVVWGGEFGRTPMSESGKGRDHNPFGFTMWMAGGGIKPGIVHGSTDELGLYAVDNREHVHDIHATILHCLGLDHKKLTYPHNGRDERATINGGKVIQGVLA